MKPTHTVTPRRVVVTGLGAITPIGLSPQAFWEAMMRGESGAGSITRFDASCFDTRFACELKGFDPLNYMDRKLARRLDPYAQYALAAARQALSDAGIDTSTLSDKARERFGVVFGSGIGGLRLFEEQTARYLREGPQRLSPFFVPMMISNMAAGLIAIEHDLRGPNYSVVSACATGNHALIDATMLLRHGHADIVLCGGSEAPITPLGIGGFNAMRALSTRNEDPKTASRPFDKNRDGFVVGEGAGALVLETLEHALARGARIYAELIGFGMSDDAYHFAAPEPTGRGACQSMQHALEDAGITPEEVDYINMHATSTPVGDPIESEAIKEVFGEHAYRLSCSATKSMTGHLLGAAGAIEAIATVLAIWHQTVPPTINVEELDPTCDLDYTLHKPRPRTIRVALSNGFGFGGHNATVAFRRYET
ncbi:MAG: beta-ketoacyl-ACP synthase II [Rhodothermus sp.]|nr:beta-ketoacyl-ACP synthase II [Rhodothermus sp.]